MSSLRYAVVGSGAIGAFYGGKLAWNGQQTDFLFHKDYEYVLARGLRIDSVDGDIFLPRPSAFCNTQSMPQADVVIVALKTVQNHLLPELLRPLLKPQTVVVMIQNGLGMEADLAAAFPHQPIVGGMAFICSNKVGPGHIRHLDYGALTLGAFQYVSSDMLQQIAADFKAAGISTHLAEDLWTARWRKLVWNIPYNGLTVVMNAQTDALNQQQATRCLLHDLMIETIEAAQACGAKIDKTFADEMIESTDRMRPYQPSMMLDFLNHRLMEIDYMYCNPIQVAAKHGFRMSKTEVLEQELRFINQTFQ